MADPKPKLKDGQHHLVLGLKAPPIHVQIKGLKEADAKPFQESAVMVGLLARRGILTEPEQRRAYRRIVKQLGSWMARQKRMTAVH